MPFLILKSSECPYAGAVILRGARSGDGTRMILTHVTIVVKDQNAALEFYTKKMGLTRTYRLVISRLVLGRVGCLRSMTSGIPLQN